MVCCESQQVFCFDWFWRFRLVCFSAFLANVFAVGQVYSFAVYFHPLMEEFGQSQAATSWVGSVSLACLLGAGMLSGKLITMYGPRIVVMMSAILFAVSMVTSSFAPNLWMLFVTYGLFVGIATSFTYLAVLISVNQYFYKYLSFATGKP